MEKKMSDALKEKLFRWIGVPLFWGLVSYGLWRFEVQPFRSWIDWTVGLIQEYAPILLGKWNPKG